MGMSPDHNKYSSPVPVIGLYTAAATLVCFLFMLYDVSIGFRRKKPWLPCRFFALNSFTLSLLSVATKLPVDITTSMPRAQDQLSKLSSTTLVCICMGFFMPSLGIVGDSEGFSNMAALTVLVVTIVVDVCVQMVTGVIFLFKVEHVIVLVCMLVLLTVLWSSILDINRGKELALDHKRNIFEKGLTGKQGSETMIKRLKWCYIYSFSSNPQFVLCQISHCATIGITCTVSFLVLSEAMLRILVQKDFKFSNITEGGECDYGWSVWVITVTQILTVLLGILAVGFRWLTLVTHMNIGRFQNWNKMFKIPSYWFYESIFGKLYSFPFKFSKIGFMNFFQVLEDFVGTVLYMMQTGVAWTNESVVLLCLLVREILSWVKRNCTKICRGFFGKGSAKVAPVSNLVESEAEYKEVVYTTGDIGLKKWILRIGFKDMSRWILLNKKDSPSHFIEFILKNSPSKPESLAQKIEQIGLRHSSTSPYEYNVSCLSVVILVRMASVALPPSFAQTLVRTLDDAFEIVYFIDRKLSPQNFDTRAKSMLAKDVWMCKDITSHWFQKNFIRPSLENYYSKTCSIVVDGDESSRLSSEREFAIGIIKELKQNSFGFLIPELHTMCEFIIRDYASIEELCDQINQLFVDVLHSFLSRLPEAIFKDVIESPIEECEERVSLALKFLCKLESLEPNIDWSFPIESEITSLLRDNSPTVVDTETQDKSSMADDRTITGDQSSSTVALDGDVTSVITNLQFLLQTPNIAKQWQTILSETKVQGWMKKSMVKFNKVE